MQDYKTRSRSDRRDDARRAPATAHTPYRPRTHRKGFSQNSDRAQAEESLEQRLGNERRSERPRQGASSQEGRYRPRTARNFSHKDAQNTQDALLPEPPAGETEATNDNRFSREERFDDHSSRRDDRRENREERFDDRKPRRDDRREKREERFDDRKPRRDDRRNDWREEREERFDDRKPRRDDRRNDRREDREERFDNRKPRRDDRRNDWREDREVRFDDRKPRRNDRRENREERFDNRKPRRDDRRNDRRDDRSPFAAKQRRRDEKEQKSYFEGLNQFLGEESSRNNRRGDRSEDRDRRNVRREDRSSLKPPVRREDRSSLKSPIRREDRAQTEQREHPLIDLSQPMRLNRYIAHCGACSRRDADEMITSGEIAINGTTCTTLGEKIIPNQDVVTRNGETLTLEQKVYILLNKPKDYICTIEDPHAEHTVLDLVKDACAERIYPVGRLDRNTTGLLLLTNDGELTDRLTHPSYAKQKTYEVTLDRKVTAHDMEQLLQGVTLDDGETAQIAYVRPNDSSTVGVTIHTGQNRVVRRMFDSLGFRVERLDRVLYAGLTKRNLPRGTWRYLTPEEVRMLKNDSYK